MNKNDLDELLKKHFFNKFSLFEKAPNIYQLFAPLYHEDGDMLDIFIKTHNANSLIVCDFGMTLMRLSYTLDVDTDRRKSILKSILIENNAEIDDGNIFIKTSPDFLFHSIMQFSQVIAKISNLKILQRATIKSLFYEMVDDYINAKLSGYHPIKDFSPLINMKEMTADYVLGVDTSRPIFLFPVRGDEKAKNAVLSMLFFQKESISFTGVVINENYDELATKQKKMLMSTADKQFYDFNDFSDNAPSFVSRFLTA